MDVIVNQYHQVPTYRNVYVVMIVLIYHMRQVLQLAEVQGDQIADVFKSNGLNEPLPDKNAGTKGTRYRWVIRR